MKILKYQLHVTDTQSVTIKGLRRILTVQVQYGVPCLWAVADPEGMPTTVIIGTYGTGNPLPAALGDYLGSYQLEDGNLVFHVFNQSSP